jgi:hypothetical protein
MFIDIYVVRYSETVAKYVVHTMQCASHRIVELDETVTYRSFQAAYNKSKELNQELLVHIANSCQSKTSEQQQTGCINGC